MGASQSRQRYDSYGGYGGYQGSYGYGAPPTPPNGSNYYGSSYGQQTPQFGYGYNGYGSNGYPSGRGLRRRATAPPLGMGMGMQPQYPGITGYPQPGFPQPGYSQLGYPQPGISAYNPCESLVSLIPKDRVGPLCI